jgi:hypothetical protein
VELVSTFERVDRALRTHRFRFGNERELQAGIERVLRDDGLTVTREARIEAGTIDFVVTSNGAALGIEVKVAGSRAAVTRQLHRYLQSDRIGALLLVTTRASLRNLPPQISGKRVFVHHLTSGAW